MDIQDGTYAARPRACSITESKNGNLMAVVKFALENGPELTFYSVLVKADGTVNTRNIEDLRKWSGWDGADPYWLMDTDLTQTPVEVVIANEPSIADASKNWPSIKWVNPPGGGGGNALPEAADRRAVTAKYGAKFRAIAGGAPVAVRPAAPSGPLAVPGAGPKAGGAVASGPGAVPPPPPVRRPPPTGAAREATQASAWNLLNEKAGPTPRAQVEELWFGFVDATGMDQVDMTPAGWAQVEAAVEAHYDDAANEPPPF